MPICRLSRTLSIKKPTLQADRLEDLLAGEMPSAKHEHSSLLPDSPDRFDVGCRGCQPGVILTLYYHLTLGMLLYIHLPYADPALRCQGHD